MTHEIAHAVIHQQEIRFADIDMMGHVNNAIFLNYFEQARMNWFSKTLGENPDWFTNGLMLARNEIDYRDAVLLTDKLQIAVWCSKIGNKSLILKYEAFVNNGVNKKIKAEGVSVLACFNHHEKKTIPVPEEWKKRITVTNNN
jgi:acyl-CoA thioester hydrolase